MPPSDSRDGAPATGRPSKPRARWRKILRISLAVFLGAVAILVGWMLLAVRPRAEARAALVSDAAVSVVQTDAHITFSPARATAPTGLLFFAGALVDPVSYAPILRRAAEAGYTGVLVKLPSRGMLGGIDGPGVRQRGLSAIADVKGVERWVVAGHSLGGGAAARFAEAGSDAIAALVLIASADPRNFSLAGARLPVTQIYGTRDTVARPEQIERSLQNLPASTRRIRIDGGNHSQFAYYGLQPGDWPATITREEQQRLLIGALLDVLAGAPR